MDITKVIHCNAMEIKSDFSVGKFQSFSELWGFRIQLSSLEAVISVWFLSAKYLIKCANLLCESSKQTRKVVTLLTIYFKCNFNLKKPFVRTLCRSSDRISTSPESYLLGQSTFYFLLYFVIDKYKNLVNTIS